MARREPIHAADESARPVATLAPGNPTTHVLVVDDEPCVRTLVRTVLERDGYRVTVTSDGAEALAAFRQGEGIDLVLLDYRMPGANGLQVYEELVRRRPGARVIFVSGFVQEADRDALLGVAGQAFLPKPYSPDQLLRLVRRVLAT